MKLQGRYSVAAIGKTSRGSAERDMWQTCLYAWSMSKMVQIRDVPDDVHTTLKVRAAKEGLSLSDFIKRELARAAERPSMHEWLGRTQQAKPILSKRSPAQLIRELRDSH
jgi:antitoxin FitA